MEGINLGFSVFVIIMLIVLFIDGIMISIAAYKSNASSYYSQQGKLQSAHKYLLASTVMTWIFFVIIVIIIIIGFVSGGFSSVSAIKKEAQIEESNAGNEKPEERMSKVDYLKNLITNEAASSRFIKPMFFVSAAFILFASVLTAVAAINLNSIRYLNNNDINTSYYDSTVGAILGITTTLLLIVTGLLYISVTSKISAFENEIDKLKADLEQFHAKGDKIVKQKLVQARNADASHHGHVDYVKTTQMVPHGNHIDRYNSVQRVYHQPIRTQVNRIVTPTRHLETHYDEEYHNGHIHTQMVSNQSVASLRRRHKND
jgi:hypothetical protein